MAHNNRCAPQLWQERWLAEVQGATTFEAFETIVQKATKQLSAGTKVSSRRARARARTLALPAFRRPKKELQLRHLYNNTRSRTLREKIRSGSSPPCQIPIEEVHRHFTNVLGAREPEGPSPWPKGLPWLPKIDHPALLKHLSRDFTLKEVKETLKKVRSKARGKNRISRRLLKQYDPGCHVLAAIFNKCKQFRRVPSAWKETSTVLAYKSGDRSDPCNWRPIYLSSTLYNMYARCLARRITNWAVGDVSPQQKAYMPFHNGQHEHHFLLQSVLDVVWRERCDIAVAKLDLTYAFGSVLHQHVFDTLLGFGMPEDFLGLIRDLYEGCTTVVRTAEGETPAITIRRGLKEGCPLSPIIFNLTIEPLIRYIANDPEGFSLYGQKVNILAYADDLVLIASERKGLQRMLDKASAAANWLSLRFNIKKCESLHISQRGHLSSEFVIQGMVMRFLQRDQAFQYLGIPLFWPSQPREILKEAFQKVVGEAHDINVSPQTPWQKMYALKTSFLPKISFLLKRLPVAKKDLEKAEYTITDMMVRWLDLSKNPTELWIPKEYGGHGVMPLRDMANVAVICHGFYLLNCSDATVKEVARGSLSITVQNKKLGRDPLEAELAMFLNGEFGCEGGDFANLWCRVRNATWHTGKFVDCIWSFDHSGRFDVELEDKLYTARNRRLEKALKEAIRNSYVGEA